MLNKIIRFFLENKLVTFLVLIVFISWGIINSPFGWDTSILPSDPVPVDAIPDIGENQQIVYTEWPGRSPQDIEDQISYPLTTSLLGIPGVKTIRSNSIFGVSSIYIIFDEDIEFYWSRTRILEKLNSLPAGTLPADVSPALGPDATALGQIYWYTLEGRDKDGNPAGGWDPHELRTIQDFYVRYSLTSAKGVAEVASIGGFVKEYQIDIDPNAMKAHGVNVAQIMAAVKNSNLDVGARTIEFNRVEYLVRAIGYIKNLEDLEKSVVAVQNNVPIRIKDVAKVNFGPATRRGGLDKGGAEAVGGVVVARYGSNPMETINNLKAKIAEIEPGLPSKTLVDGTISKVTIVPFYDRTGLIKETLGTLEEAISLELLISILVVIVLVLNLRASFLISSLLPIGVLITFITMRRFSVDANIVALSGIAIAIGVMVDVGVVFTENIIRHIEMVENIGARGKKLLNVVYEATTEVAGAVITALSTTIVSFLPVFAMEAAEGKLFKPLAFTKTFTMLAALLIGLIIIPTLAHLVFSIRFDKNKYTKILSIALIITGLVLSVFTGYYIALALTAYGLNSFFSEKWPETKKAWVNYINIGITVIVVVFFLNKAWMPLGAQNSMFVNFLFVIAIIAIVLGLLSLVVVFYRKILSWCLENKWAFLSVPIFIVVFGITSWQGFDKLFGFMPGFVKKTAVYQNINKALPGIGKEFMPSLDEGSFLLMPTTMPHSGIEENLEVIRILDKKINSIPEVEIVVGKWGRVNSALDPAPTSMYENVINYKAEYILNEDGHRMRFKVDRNGAFILKNNSTYNPKEDGFRLIEKENLTEYKNGEYFRQWRDEIKTPNDIWDEIISEATIPGLTSAPKLQPIQTRLVMLQTGMRAPMGIKVFGPTLESIEKVGYEIEKHLKQVEGVRAMSVFADRVVGKPYLEMEINRDAISRYGISVKNLQNVLSSAIGGMQLTTTVEGRERFPVRLRYAREYRDNPEDLKKILIPTPNGTQIPLGDLVTIHYTRGPQLIKSENTFLVGYVIFDKKEGFAEVDVVENAQAFLKDKIESGEFQVPSGVSYVFTGNYENQIRATKRLMIVVPVSLMIIFLILYFQFRSVISTSLIFTGIIVAISGGFIMLWLYGQPWFMNGELAGIHLRNLFQVHTINLSVAVWVGFIALFGVATDDGVLISTYIKQLQEKKSPTTVKEVRQLVLEAGSKRVRPAIMTTATTIIALLPILTSTGKGSDIMVPMAIPLFGGMTIEVLTMFVVPVLYSMWQEGKVKASPNPSQGGEQENY
ncbi:MAG: efflux RND transporter permease subunit [Prolixibacteraceae bacterium]|jgi:copper/silver efflux system protein|nr:efflux RND transporter permease subunit [Prolixibacteraceae bacterium]MBT6007203.1 efflux RND transporter permease subunit [Prolixibacteraceae bacterium]MBT6997707.1 efflux RND transporter permease subunit [Prolixibacteraceae bacterium]MBT7394721.1 efflux RND transporter permease subunit [Prolixibacteraceae bacterium]